MTSFDPLSERRRAGRRGRTAAPLQYLPFNTSRLHDERPGRLRNQSALGACFHATRQYPPGTVLFIRKDATCTPGATAAFPGQTVLAEVRWCVPAPGRRPNAYTIGVRFL